MPPRSSVHSCTLRFLLALGATAATLTGPASAADKERTVDTTCAWGRLSDGKGRLIRCLTRDEATRLRAPTPAAAPAALGTGLPSTALPAPAAPAPSVGAPLATGAPLAVPALAKPSVAAPPVLVAASVGGAAPPVAAPSEASPPAEPGPANAESELMADVGSVVADEGALPDALKSLRKVRDRYAECVDRNGGLTADRGEVELRFLVQGKGRAEGVSVKKRRGLGEVAAKCVADVVDRRYVGYPEAPAVGASVVVAIMKKKR